MTWHEPQAWKGTSFYDGRVYIKDLSNADAAPAPLADQTAIDSLRTALGLPPLPEASVAIGGVKFAIAQTAITNA